VPPKPLAGAAALLAAVAALLLAPPAGAKLERARCSSAQPAQAQLRCGRANVHRGSSALRFLRHHRKAGDRDSRASVRRSGRYLVRYGWRHVRAASSRMLPWAFWDCVATGILNGRRVSKGEGAADSYNPAGYYGRYQMDWTFQRTHGADMLRKYGGRDARSWSLLDQTTVAERGYRAQGPGAWPLTAPPCLSLRN
jgi:hypothetical protein